MSKYVRIKSGVYKIIHTCLNGDYLIDKEIWDGLPEGVRKRDIVKEADTIEELCDVFVSESEVLGHITQNYLYDFDTFKKRWFEGYNAADFYGAIKVKGKGLIYIAKMNEKGELKLI